MPCLCEVSYFIFVCDVCIVIVTVIAVLWLLSCVIASCYSRLEQIWFNVFRF